VAGAETEACSTGPKPGEEGTGGIPQFRVQIVDDQAIALPDETVNYTATIKNTGKVPYKDARAMIDLSDILDDASWVGNLKADSGTVGGPVNVAEFLKNAAPRPRSLPAQGPRGRAYTPETGGDGPILWWTGDLAVGGQAVITYTVKVDNPPKGNMRLLSQIMGQAPSTNCENNPEAKKSPECATDVLIPLLKLDKKLDAPANPKPGDKVTYTVTLSNAGTGDFEKAWFSDDLSGVLDDAKLDEGSIKATGGKVTYSKPKLRWDGTVPAKGTVTVTYSLTVVGDRSGDGKLVNGLVSDLPGSNCRTGSTADVCKGGPAAAGGVKITQQAAPEKSSPKSPAQQAVTAPWPKSVPKKPWITPSTGAMIGITAGVGLLAALAGGFLLVLARRNRRRDAE
jgi:uncharacterized repeat protein (TIGR01451 family)